MDVIAEDKQCHKQKQVKRLILSQITQITQMNAAGCIISQRKAVGS
jgi:hypothetical protein